MIAYRVWMVAGLPDGSPPYALRSPWRGTLWHGPSLRADERPEPTNQHGVHALTRYAAAVPLGFGRTPFGPILVRGQVYLSGTVVEHEDGTLRAEEAEVLRLGLVRYHGTLVAYDQHPIPLSILRLGPRQPTMQGHELAVTPRELLRTLLQTYHAAFLSEWPWGVNE